MNDTPEEPGWWQASDGRWYPPEQHTLPAGDDARTAASTAAPASLTPASLTPASVTAGASDPVPVAVLAPAAAEDGPVADGLFRRMLRLVVEHYVSGTEKSERPRGGDVTVDHLSLAGSGDDAVDGDVADSAIGVATRPTRWLAGDPTADPFEPIPEHPARSPLSLRRRTPRRPGSSDDLDFVLPPPSRRPTQQFSQRTLRHDVVPVPSGATSFTLRRRRVLPWGTVALVLLVVLAAALGGYWYRGRASAHRSPVDAAEAFVRALYGDSSPPAQSMIVPGQHLDVPTHPQATITFGATSVAGDGAGRTVDVLACLTNNGTACGPQTGNSTTVVVPTRQVDGSWYVDQTEIAACTDTNTGHQVVVCQR